MIVWRDKFIAFGVHLLATLALAGAAAAIFFFVWFPAPFQEIVGGNELFGLVVGCDIGLGPLMSLVIYNRAKSRRELLFDYAIVGAVQIAALAYGLYIAAGTRVCYLAFALDRYEVVTARDLAPAELAAAHDPQYSRVPLGGLRYVAIVVPPKDQDDALFQSLNGNEEQRRPKFYVQLESQLALIRERAQPLEALEKKHPAAKPALEAARAAAGVPDSRLRWLPLHYKEKFWTALIDTQTGRPVRYVDLDPY